MLPETRCTLQSVDGSSRWQTVQQKTSTELSPKEREFQTLRSRATDSQLEGCVLRSSCGKSDGGALATWALPVETTAASGAVPLDARVHTGSAAATHVVPDVVELVQLQCFGYHRQEWMAIGWERLMNRLHQFLVGAFVAGSLVLGALCYCVSADSRSWRAWRRFWKSDRCRGNAPSTNGKVVGMRSLPGVQHSLQNSQTVQNAPGQSLQNRARRKLQNRGGKAGSCSIELEDVELDDTRVRRSSSAPPTDTFGAGLLCTDEEMDCVDREAEDVDLLRSEVAYLRGAYDFSRPHGAA